MEAAQSSCLVSNGDLMMAQWLFVPRGLSGRFSGQDGGERLNTTQHCEAIPCLNVIFSVLCLFLFIVSLDRERGMEEQTKPEERRGGAMLR